jgi:hypothetical protein
LANGWDPPLNTSIVLIYLAFRVKFFLPAGVKNAALLKARSCDGYHWNNKKDIAQQQPVLENPLIPRQF